MLVALKATLLTLPLLAVSAPAHAATATPAARAGSNAAAAARGGGGSPTGLRGLRPDPDAIPGGPQAESLLEGVMYYGVLIASISLVLAAALMGVGKWRRNPGYVESGQTGVVWSLAGAAAIGGCGALIGWAFGLGSAIK